MAREKQNLRVVSEEQALGSRLRKSAQREVFLFCPTPLPLGEDHLKQIPIPGPEGQDLSQGLPGGMVTGQIEPCITCC